MAEANKGHVLGGTAIKPIERHGWERIRYILYNPETGQILSRFEIVCSKQRIRLKIPLTRFVIVTKPYFWHRIGLNLSHEKDYITEWIMGIKEMNLKDS